MALDGLKPGGSLAEAPPDWRQPWFTPVADTGRSAMLACDAGLGLAAALSVQLPVGERLRFVPQSELPAGTAYEQHIFDTARVPTRDNLHDFFNGLIWLRFPLTKRCLNRLQAEQIAQAGIAPVRGPVRDALTLFDENAALLQAPDAIWQALLVHDWQRLFIDLRPLWPQARLVLFGHALLEKLVAPYKSITAHVYRMPVPLTLGSEPAHWDAWLADQLTAPELASKPFAPLPVLGVPGWWPANEDPAFYNDTTVFRAARSTHSALTGMPCRKNRT